MILRFCAHRLLPVYPSILSFSTLSGVEERLQLASGFSPGIKAALASAKCVLRQKAETVDSLQATTFLAADCPASLRLVPTAEERRNARSPTPPPTYQEWNAPRPPRLIETRFGTYMTTSITTGRDSSTRIRGTTTMERIEPGYLLNCYRPPCIITPSNDKS